MKEDDQTPEIRKSREGRSVWGSIGGKNADYYG